MLTFCFDEVYQSPCSLTVKTSAANQRGPILPYWVAMSCFMAPGRMQVAGANEDGVDHMQFVYVAELHASSVTWSMLPGDELLITLPPPVERAVGEGRGIVLISLAHESNEIFNSSAAADERSLLDRLADVAGAYRIPPEQLWLVTADTRADVEASAWMLKRGLSELPFTLRVCEIASFGFGLAMRESLSRARGPVHLPVHRRVGAAHAGWAQSRFVWIDRPFPGFPPEEGGGWPDPRFPYACLNRMFRPQRWWVLERLWREGLLGEGLVSFPAPLIEHLAMVGREPIPADLLELVEMLPLTAGDGLAPSMSRDFLFQNSYAVTTIPEPVARDCGVQIVTETWFDAPPFVTEKSLKALVGRGPAVFVGPAGNLAYLHSLGVQTWGDLIDESYDEPASDEIDGRPGAAGLAARFALCMETALGLVRNPGATAKIERAGEKRRSENIRWLTQARKPWDDLLDELDEALATA